MNRRNLFKTLVGALAAPKVAEALPAQPRIRLIVDEFPCLLDPQWINYDSMMPRWNLVNGNWVREPFYTPDPNPAP